MFIFSSFSQQDKKKVKTDSIVLVGIRKKGSVYVSNPMVDTSSYSIKKVLVNNKINNVNINTGAFLLNLTKYKVGDTLTIKVVYDKRFLPKIHSVSGLQEIKTDLSKVL